MIFSLPISFEEVSLDSETLQFTVGIQKSLVVDPFDKLRGYLGGRLIDESRFFPFMVARGLYKASPKVLLFVRKEDNSMIGWMLANQGMHYMPIRYIIVGLDELNATVQGKRLLQAYMQCLQTSRLMAPQWAAQKIDAIMHHHRLSTESNPSFQPRSINSHFLSALLYGYLRHVNEATSELVDFVDKKLDVHTSSVIRRLFDIYCSKVQDPKPASFVETAKYCALREFIYMVSGMHVILDPYTSSHILSNEFISLFPVSHESSGPNTPIVRIQESDLKFSSSRLIRYTSPCGVTFVERRGEGWLDVSSQIYFSTQSYLEIQTGQQWNHNLGAEEISLLNKVFSPCTTDLLTGKAGQRPIIINIDCGSGVNLGHVLWNEASGLIELAKIFAEANWIPHRLLIHSPFPVKSRFSDTPLRGFFYAYVERTLESIAAASSSPALIKRFLKAFRDGVPGPSFKHYGTASFRYPRVSKDLVRQIRADFAVPDTPQSTTVLVNVRAHNKSLVNIHECFSALIEKLSMNIDCRSQKIVFALECAEDGKPTAIELSDLLISRGFQCTLYVGCGLNKLIGLVMEACVCVIPVGSGLVTPTWICKKICVVHGDRMHMAQLEWWPYVGCGVKDLYPIPETSIADATDEFYSDYRIDPQTFANTVSEAIDASRCKEDAYPLAYTLPLRRADIESMGLRGLHLSQDCTLHYGFINCSSQPVEGNSDRNKKQAQFYALGQHTYLYLNPIATLPIETESLDWVLNQHLIQSMTFEQSVQLLRELHRVLKPNGVLRISTPDLGLLIQDYNNNYRSTDPESQANAKPKGHLSASRPGFALNNIFHNDNHRWLYDFDEVIFAAQCAGFDPALIRRWSYRKGSVQALAQLDMQRHSDEDLYVEIKKAAPSGPVVSPEASNSAVLIDRPPGITTIPSVYRFQ